MPTVNLYTYRHRRSGSVIVTDREDPRRVKHGKRLPVEAHKDDSGLILPEIEAAMLRCPFTGDTEVGTFELIRVDLVDAGDPRVSLLRSNFNERVKAIKAQRKAEAGAA